MTTDAPEAPGEKKVRRSGTTMEIGLDETDAEQLEEPAADATPATTEAEDGTSAGGGPVIGPDNWHNP
jgi:hypothetical protein